MPDCPLLEKLPSELRLQIYAHLLHYTHHIKRRQIVPGSRDLALLRVNKQIYDEALPVLYDVNTIIVTRNDFCKCTDAGLKTPLELGQARHLLITSFCESIACNLAGQEGRCDVCQPSATGLIEALVAMPRLRTVLVDYLKYTREMVSFEKAIETEGVYALEAVPDGSLVTPYWLRGPGIGSVGIQFKFGR